MDKTDCGADKQNNSRRIRRRKKPGQQEDCSDSASAQIITNNDTGDKCSYNIHCKFVYVQVAHYFLRPHFARHFLYFCTAC